MLYSLLALASTVALAGTTNGIRRMRMERSLKFGLVEDWQDDGASKPETVQKVAFALKMDPHKRELADKLFWEVSNPKSDKYGQYLNGEEIQEYIAHSEEDIAAVTDFLSLHGVDQWKVGTNKDIIFAAVEIGTLEQMLETTFHTFSSKKYGMSVDRIIEGYTLPEYLTQIVGVVDGIAVFPGNMKVQSPQVGAATWDNYCPGAATCAGKITPNITAEIYNSAPLAAGFTVAQGNGVAVAEFQTQKYDTADLEEFGKSCNIPTIQVTDVNGNGQGNNGGIECMLDLEYISGNGLGIPLEDYFYYQYSLITWANQLVSQGGSGALVHSVSYGNDEIQQTSTDYMLQCNDAFMSAGLLGYTLMFASGDQGVWGRTGYGTTFHPDFPASSPYITAVGGTDFTSSSPSLSSYTEKCSVDGGGGFSNTFAMPSYQTAAVQGYLNSGVALPASQYYNATGRAYPDISAEFGLVVSYCIVANGKWTGVAGTSASCPVVAHGIGILNNIQLAAGKPALGPINQWLYQTLDSNPSAFTDITTGENNENKGTGFSATTGWDPCSGVGTPNFENMAKSLP